ncbi:MAG: DUF1648 domain-containing protein [Leptospiraceae bacterium]|nr:DUF1648 domain-containing protein [Leptospiraceae bacterium]
MKTTYQILNIVLIAVGTIWGFSTWNSIPDKIPVHFSFSGEPDRWTTKGIELAIIILLPLLMSLFLYGMFVLSRKYPTLLNIPNKEKFLSLSKERQKPLWDILNEFISSLALLCSILFFSLYYSIVQVTIGTNANLNWFMALVFIFFILSCIFYIKKILRILE